MIDLILGLLDKLFKDEASGELLFSRLVALIIVFFICFVWFKGDALMEMYKQSRYSQYAAILSDQKNTRFNTVVQEQIGYAYVSSGANLAVIYTFRPKNLNYFVDILTYQGKLPDLVDPKNLGGFPIDKGSDQYETENTGGYYHSTNEFIFLPSRIKTTKQISYMFSCPYFNLDNVYSGAVEMYWYDGKKPDIPDNRLSGICGQASRAIGRAK